MYRYALGVLKSPADAEDAVGETVLKAYAHLAQLKAPEHFRSWAMSILVNVTRTMLTCRKRLELSNHGCYEISALKSLEQEWDEEKIEVHFTEYSYYTYENGDTIPHTIRGDWSLMLPLGENTILKADVYEPGQPVEIAGVSVHVKRVEVSPLSLLLTFDLDDLEELRETLYAGETDVYLKEVECSGFLDLNGNELLTGLGGMSGKYDFDKREAIYQTGFGSYVNPSDLSIMLLGDDKIKIPLK